MEPTDKDQTISGLGSMSGNLLDQLGPVGGTFILGGAVSTLEHATKHAHAINLLLIQYNLCDSDKLDLIHNYFLWEWAT